MQQLRHENQHKTVNFAHLISQQIRSVRRLTNEVKEMSDWIFPASSTTKTFKIITHIQAHCRSPSIVIIINVERLWKS